MEDETVRSHISENTAKDCNTGVVTTSLQQKQPTADHSKSDDNGNEKAGGKVCQTFSIASSVTATWQRPSDAVHQLMSDTMMQATGHCCLKYSTTDDDAKCQLDLLTSRVMQRLLSVKAPEDNRLDDYHGARTSMMCVGSELTEAMTASQKVKHKLKKQKRLLTNLQRETEALQAYLSNRTPSKFEFLTAAKVSDINKDTFVENMMSLLMEEEEIKVEADSHTQH